VSSEHPESTTPNIDERIRSLPDLPPLPHIAQIILREISNEDVDIKRLASVIEMDPAMMARIVGIANSAYFGNRGNIYTVSDAIIKVLGLNTVRSLALSIVLSQPFTLHGKSGLRLDQYWYQAMMTATMLQSLAPLISVSGYAADANTFYLAGLLHNMGLLVLYHAMPDETAAALREAQESDGTGTSLSSQPVCGISATVAGGALGRRWHLPQPAIVAMEHHCNPGYDGEHWPLALLTGACARSVSLGGEEDGVSDLNDDLIAALGMERTRLDHPIARLRERRQEIVKLAGILALD
jgi:HD-like signal output (HDOD) protein